MFSLRSTRTGRMFLLLFMSGALFMYVLDFSTPSVLPSTFITYTDVSVNFYILQFISTDNLFFNHVLFETDDVFISTAINNSDSFS